MHKLIDLIKQSGAVREFKEREIPTPLIDKIIEAGIWGLSVLGIQPWKFVPVKNKAVIAGLSKIVLDKSDNVVDGANIVLRVTSRIIQKAGAIIVVYNNQKLEKRAEKFGQLYVKRAYVAEIQAIGGAIQNMILQTNELGLGCVWLDAITFCSKEINCFLKEDGELVAFVAIGYPATKPHRSKKQDDNVKKSFI